MKKMTFWYWVSLWGNMGGVIPHISNGRLPISRTSNQWQKWKRRVWGSCPLVVVCLPTVNPTVNEQMINQMKYSVYLAKWHLNSKLHSEIINGSLASQDSCPSPCYQRKFWRKDSFIYLFTHSIHNKSY